MIFIPEEEWQLYGIPPGLHRFFIMTWDELLSDDTPDTWQLRTSNVLSVLAEIIEVLNVVEEHDLSRHNVPVLLAEAAAMIQIDPVIPKHFPFVSDYLPRWASAGSGSGEGSIDLLELRKRVNVIVGQLQTYHQHAINDLREILRLDNPKLKNDAYRLTMAVAVGWSVMGYSREHLSDVSDLLDSSNESFIDRFDRFIRRCDGVMRRYQCRFGFNWPGDILPSAGLIVPGVKLTKAIPSDLLSEQERQFYGRPNSEDVFAEITVEAFDPVSAYRAAEAKVSSVLAALNLYFTNKRFELKGSIALVSDGEQTFAPKIERKRIFKSLLDRNDAAIHVKRFLNLLHSERLDSEDIDQIASALQYHRLAISATTDESRLVNLWIALECLARREHSSIIGAVCRYIAPNAAIGNIGKILGNVARYVNAYVKWKKLTIPTEVFTNSTSVSLEMADLLEALLDTEDGLKINALYALIGEHELIRFRVFRLRKKTLSTAARAAETMKFHMQNIEWQLRRIYRLETLSLIVEEGRLYCRT